MTVKKLKKFSLEDWYSSEEMKRRLGAICQAVDETGGKTSSMGRRDRPLIVISAARETPLDSEHVILSIDEAKADWSNVVSAALHYGTIFRIQGKAKERAILRAHPDNKPGARKYIRAKQGSLGGVAGRLETILDELRDIARKIERSADIFLRRTTEIWRLENNYPQTFPAERMIGN